MKTVRVVIAHANVLAKIARARIATAITSPAKEDAIAKNATAEISKNLDRVETTIWHKL